MRKSRKLNRYPGPTELEILGLIHDIGPISPDDLRGEQGAAKLLWLWNAGYVGAQGATWDNSIFSLTDKGLKTLKRKD